jgi:predicted patatin/cPLA2 family phospholipase
MNSPVLEILRARAANRSTPPHGDGASVALCIEGGAMRGVVSAGMVTALEQLGMLECFDAVYGSSAGAMNGAYFLAGQAAFGTTIYYEDINNALFIDFTRPLRGRPVVDLDYLVGDVIGRRKPLDTTRVLASRIPLTAVATDARTAARHAFRDFQDAQELLSALRAGSSMPIVAGPPYVRGNGEYFDALLTEPVPVPIAESDGHTHLLALLTRPASSADRQMSYVERVLIAPRLNRISPALGRLYVERIAAYTALLKHIAAGRGPGGRAIVLGVHPAGPVVGKLERRRARLVAGATRGAAAIFSLMTGRALRCVETLTGFDESSHRVTPDGQPSQRSPL